MALTIWTSVAGIRGAPFSSTLSVAISRSTRFMKACMSAVGFSPFLDSITAIAARRASCFCLSTSRSERLSLPRPAKSVSEANSLSATAQMRVSKTARSLG